MAADMSATSEPQGWVPRPDPTILTTEALIREIAHLRELMETQIEGLGDACEAKFEYIEQRLRDRTLLVDAAFEASREAVAAALASSKEAVAKSEGTFNKQLDEMKLTMAAANKGIEDQIGAVKERVTIIESLDRGAEKKSEGMSAAAALTASAIAVIVGIAGIVLAVIAATGR
jgi:hypothetical protein